VGRLTPPSSPGSHPAIIETGDAPQTGGGHDDEGVDLIGYRFNATGRNNDIRVFVSLGLDPIAGATLSRRSSNTVSTQAGPRVEPKDDEALFAGWR